MKLISKEILSNSNYAYYYQAETEEEYNNKLAEYKEHVAVRYNGSGSFPRIYRI